MVECSNDWERSNSYNLLFHGFMTTIFHFKGYVKIRRKKQLLFNFEIYSIFIINSVIIDNLDIE